MSYTLTLDVPEKTADYVSRQGVRLSRELNAIFVAIIQEKMRCDESLPKADSNGKVVFDALRACPVDVDLGQLISKRKSCGRAHPIDFASLLQEDA